MNTVESLETSRIIQAEITNLQARLIKVQQTMVLNSRLRSDWRRSTLHTVVQRGADGSWSRPSPRCLVFRVFGTVTCGIPLGTVDTATQKPR